MSTSVLHVAQPSDGGVARCVLELARWQQEHEGLAVSVACPPDGALADDLRAAGVPVLAWPASREPGPAVFAEAHGLGRLVESAAPDLVHLHSAKAGLAGRLVLRGHRPTAFSPHAWSWEAATGPVRAAATGWERVASRWTSLLVCVSEAERAAGQRAGCLPARVVVVPNGVDVRALQPASGADRTAARTALGLADVPTAVLVGRLTRQKGQDVALAAWSAVRAAVPDAHLVLVGDGPGRAALDRGDDGVTLVGSRPDATRFYAAADVVLVPSRWEGMALTVLEAMACGRSVVASDVTGVRESLPEGAGTVVPADDVAALATAVVARLDGPVDADAEGRAGRRHAEQAHDVRTTTAATTAACLDLLAD